MCVGLSEGAVLLSGDSASPGLSSGNFGKLRVLLANVRGLRQAAAELSKRVTEFKPHLIGLVETHLLKDPLSGLLPYGYRAVNRLDRSKHGGGLLWCAQSHLLVDKINTGQYNTVDAAEICGIRFMGQDFPLCYTPKSSLVPLLIDACEQYALDNPMRSITFLGDFNCHNPDWLTSRSLLNKGGERVEEFCEMFGFFQMIDFPTRQGNTLDLVMTRCAGLAQERLVLGTSDHVSIELELETEKLVPITP
jgi:hypothetical protein